MNFIYFYYFYIKFIILIYFSKNVIDVNIIYINIYVHRLERFKTLFFYCICCSVLNVDNKFDKC